MTQSDQAFIKALLSAPGASSFESKPAALWREHAAKLGGEVRQDSYGNSFATFRTGGKPRIVLAGHIDEIGLIVSYIDKDGLLYVKGVGGWDPQQLTGQRVRVVGYKGELIGVIGKKPIHLMNAEDRKKTTKIEDLWIDIGAKDGDDAKKHVRAGDFAVIEQPFVELLNGRMVSKAIDNRIGAYIVLEAARRVQKGSAEVIAAATVQEEISGVGAHIASYALEPDMAIAVDVTHATDVPGVDKKQEGDTPLGSGPQLSVGSVVHRGMLNRLIDIAEAEKIPYSINASPYRTATDADDLARARWGVPTTVVSIPNRYMHSPNEMIDLEDLEQVIQLIVKFIEQLEPKTELMQP